MSTWFHPNPITAHTSNFKLPCKEDWDNLLKNASADMGEVMKKEELALPNQDAGYLKDNIVRLFKRLAEHYHYQFQFNTSYLPTSIADWTFAENNYRQESAKANECLSQLLENGLSSEGINLAEKNLKVVPTSSEETSLQHVKNVWLSKNQIRWIPTHWFDQFTQIQSLDLSENQLNEIPDSIGRLKHLRYLHLTDNKIKEVPEWIGELTNLESFSLYKNKIVTLPESIGNLKALKSFSIGENQLRIFPQSMENLNIECFHVTADPLNSNTILLQFFVVPANIHWMEGVKRELSEKDLPLILSKMKIFKAYDCKSEFAKLCQFLITKDEKEIKKAFESLKKEDKKLIYQCIENLPDRTRYNNEDEVEMTALLNIQAFGKAVANAAWQKFDRLSDDNRNAVFEKVCKLAGRQPKTSHPEWGKKHARDEILRLVDAMDGFEMAPTTV